MSAAATAVGPPIRTDAFLTRVVVLVDECTEPTISEAEASQRRNDLISMTNTNGGTSGANVAFAIRKRLKSDDSSAVMNTLKLLDELMRSCPYFFRYVADDKMFRRLWRFVVPDYKNGMKSFLKTSKTALDLRSTAGRPDIAIKVLTLIRAWAEELSQIFHGSYDPAAGFLIERYNSKRQRIKFPDVPRTELPWICPINTNGPAGSSAGSSSRGTFSNSKKAKLPESLSLAEVENTFNLFDNIVEKATEVSELKTDTCKELVYRCRIIADNMDRLSMSMDKEEELTRAIKVSEKLRATLDAYDASIRTGEISKPIPIVNSLTEAVDSDYSRGRTTTEDEAYMTPPPDQPLPRGGSDRYSREKNGFNNSSPSLKSSSGRPRLPRGVTSVSRFGRKSSGEMPESRSHDSHLDSLNGDGNANGDDSELSAKERQEKREEAQKRFHREYVASKRAAAGGSSSSIKASGYSGPKERERSDSPGSRRKLERSKTSIPSPSSSRRKRMEDRVDSSADDEPPRRTKSTRKKHLDTTTDDDPPRKSKPSRKKDVDTSTDDDPPRKSKSTRKKDVDTSTDDDIRDREEGEEEIVERKKKTKGSSKSLKKSKGSKGLGVTSAKPPRKGKDGKRRMGGRSASAVAGPSSSNLLVDVDSGGNDAATGKAGRRLPDEEYSSSSDEEEENQDLFAKLGEKYVTNKSDSDTNTVNIAPEQGQLQTIPPPGQMAMYNTNPYGQIMMPMPMQPPQMMYNSMNPMNMYNSFNPYYNPMAAYASQNPMAAYASNMGNPMTAYASHNPQMAAYASQNPMMPQFPAPPQFMQPPTQQQMPQTPVQQMPQAPPQGSPSPPRQPLQQQQNVASPPSMSPPGQTQPPQSMNLPMPQPPHSQALPSIPAQQPLPQASASMDQMSINPQMAQMPMGMPPQMPAMFPPSGDSFSGMPSMPGMPSMAPMAAAPPPPPPATYTTVTNAPLPPPNTAPPPAPAAPQSMAQAAMYQQTMANAAAMYQAAAAAYQSVQGQPPLQPNANITATPASAAPPTVVPANAGGPPLAPAPAPIQQQQNIRPQVTEPPTATPQ